jgi:hypothetical protein
MAKLRRRKPQADGITVRRKSRAFFQQHRPKTEVTRRPRFGRDRVKSGHNSDIAEVKRLTLCGHPGAFKNGELRGIFHTQARRKLEFWPMILIVVSSGSYL